MKNINTDKKAKTHLKIIQGNQQCEISPSAVDIFKKFQQNEPGSDVRVTVLLGEMERMQNLIEDLHLAVEVITISQKKITESMQKLATEMTKIARVNGMVGRRKGT